MRNAESDQPTAPSILAPPVETARAIEEKMLEAMIDAATLRDPKLRDVLTKAAVWQYLQLPDDSFGWSARIDGKPVPMPRQAKSLCIITTLSIGLMPGLGHVLWLGNRCYVTAEARSHAINQSPDVVRIGELLLRPFNDAEKEMFAIEKGDMHCFVQQLVRFKGAEYIWSGHGIIGGEEFDKVGRDNRRMPGLQSKKDAAQTLKTRAIRDMERRNFPLGGLLDSADAPEVDYSTTIDINTSQPKAENSEVDANRLRAETISKAQTDEARARFKGLRDRAAFVNGNIDSILGENAFEIYTSATAEKLHDASDVLEHWLAEYERPDPEPTPPKPPKVAKPVTEKPAPAAAAPTPVTDTPPKRGRGRPPKNPQPAIPKIEDQKVIFEAEAPKVEDVAADENIDQEREPWDSGEPPIDELALSEVDEEFEAKFADEFPSEDFEDDKGLGYTGTESQRAILWREANNAGLTSDVLKFQLAFNMQNKPLSELANEIKSLVQETLAKKPDPAPAIDPPENRNAAILKAAARLKNAIEYVKKSGGSPLKIAGEDPLYILDSGVIADMETISDRLEAWQPKEKPAPVAEVVEEALKPTPTSGPGINAYNMLNRALTDATLSPNVKERLISLRSRVLRDGDHLYLPKAIREAKGGVFKDIDNLIGQREIRG